MVSGRRGNGAQLDSLLAGAVMLLLLVRLLLDRIKPLAQEVAARLQDSQGLQQL